MRVVVAALLVFGSVVAPFWFFATHYPGEPWPGWSGPLILFVFFGAIFASLAAFNRRGLYTLKSIWSFLDQIRVVLAALFVLTVLFAANGLVESSFPGRNWSLVTQVVFYLVLFASLFVALFLFNKRGFRPSLSRKSLAEQIEELRQKGWLSEESFTARRAFQVEEFEDEGFSYFIELSDGRTLFLSGQYLYDFAPIDDDPDSNQARRFPCTEFTVLRHKEALYVMDIVCSGTVLEPEVVAPPFSVADFQKGIPEDGAVLTNPTYDEIKRQRMTGDRT